MLTKIFPFHMMLLLLCLVALPLLVIILVAASGSSSFVDNNLGMSARMIVINVQYLSKLDVDRLQL